MWAVYFCGPTDCFLQAMFMGENAAKEWVKLSGREDLYRDGGSYIEFVATPEEIDRTDTGWE